jgi:hypothetical protein
VLTTTPISDAPVVVSKRRPRMARVELEHVTLTVLPHDVRML